MRKIVMIVILVASMVQGVFAQQIIIKGTVKDATSKKAAEYVNVVLQTADSVFVGGTITNSKGDFLLNKVYAGDYWHYPVWDIVRNLLY